MRRRKVWPSTWIVSWLPSSSFTLRGMRSARSAGRFRTNRSGGSVRCESPELAQILPSITRSSPSCGVLGSGPRGVPGDPGCPAILTENRVFTTARPAAVELDAEVRQLRASHRWITSRPSPAASQYPSVVGLRPARARGCPRRSLFRSRALMLRSRRWAPGARPPLRCEPGYPARGHSLMAPLMISRSRRRAGAHDHEHVLRAVDLVVAPCRGPGAPPRRRALIPCAYASARLPPCVFVGKRAPRGAGCRRRRTDRLPPSGRAGSPRAT